jgi:serine/threonine protein kinase/WD40 repeat protein
MASDQHNLDQHNSDALMALAESYLARLRQGEAPAIDDYADGHPELASEIRALFPTLQMVEQLGDRSRFGGIQPTSVATIPSRLGEFQLIREVARGGMGIVFEAIQTTLGRRVAIKVLPPADGSTTSRRLRFQREARAAANLHHTNIVPVFDVGEQDGIYYYAMQFIDGESLADVWAELRRLKFMDRSQVTEALSAGTLPPQQRSNASALLWTSSVTSTPRHYLESVARMVLQIADALTYAHAQCVLHRDIKPSNIILDAKCNAWLTDFGLAKVGADELTADGSLLGTLRYMSPERFSGKVDAQSDVYSAGLILYEFTTLHPAFQTSDSASMMRLIQSTEPTRPREVNPTIPKDLETIILCAISKDASHRYATAEAFASDLRNFLEHRPIAARRATNWERLHHWARRNPTLASTLVGVTALLIVVASTMSLLSWRLSRSLATSEELRSRATLAEADRTKQLRQSLWQQARSARLSAQPGARVQALTAIREAAAIRPGLDVRNEAIAAMALMDIRPTPVWAQPIRSPVAAFGPTLDYYINLEDSNSAVIRDKHGNELQRFAATSFDASFSPDGRFLIFKDSSHLVESGKEYLKLLDWQLGREHLRLGTSFPGRPFAFHPHGTEWAVRSDDGAIHFYQLPDCIESRRFDLPGSSVSLAYHPSGNSIAYFAEGHREISLMDTRTGAITPLATAPAELFGRVSFNHDGSLIAAGALNWRSYVWDCQNGELMSTLNGHGAEVTNVQFAPRSNLLATSSWDRSTRLWDVNDGRTLARLEGLFCGFNPDGDHLAFVGGSQLGVLRCASAKELRVMRGHSGKNPRWCAFSPDGHIIVTSGFDGIRLMSTGDGALLGTIPLSTLSVEFTPHGDSIITASATGVYQWPFAKTHPDERQCEQWKLGPPIALSSKNVVERRARLTVDGQQLIVASQPEQYIAVIQVDRRQEFEPGLLATNPSVERESLATKLPCGLGPNECCVSPDGKWLVASSWGNRWWAAYDLPARRLVCHHNVTVTPSLAFSPDSRWLVASSQNGGQVISTESWTVARELPLESANDQLSHVTFSAAGRMLALARSDGIILLLDCSTFQEIARLESPVGEHIYHLEFSGDGSQLAACVNGGVQLWDLGLIRQGLREMRLAWDPRRPPVPRTKPQPIELMIDTGELFNK